MSDSTQIDIAQRLTLVRERINAAENNHQRTPGAVDLLAVSKTHSSAAIRRAAAAEQKCFGESYLQEAQDKINALQDLDLEWHFIGPIQTNKAKGIALDFAWVHSVDRLKIAQKLSEQRPEHLAPLQMCLQVNVSGEDSKSGVTLAELAELAQAVVQLPRLNLRGLMTIPARTDDLSVQRHAFASLRLALEALNAKHDLQLDTLSMGMSSDMEAAIAEGATIVRIGTDIFGPRK